MADWIKYCELIALFTGVVYYKKYWGSYLRYFIFLLGFVTFFEFCQWLLKSYFMEITNNTLTYNMVTFVNFFYYLTLYAKVLVTDRYKKLIKWFVYTFVIGAIVNLIFIQKLTEGAAFQSYTFALGAILLIASIGLFFTEILKTEKILYFKEHLMFWISIGLFVFSASIIPIILATNLSPEEIDFKMIGSVHFALNLIMYASFTIGFVVSDKYVD